MPRKLPVSRSQSPLALFAVLLLLAGLWGACQDETPEQRVARVRQNYSVELHPFAVRQVPLEPMMGDEEMTGEGEEGSEGTEGEGDEMMEPLTRTDVVLDFLLSHEGRDSLPGVTLDISQVGADQVEKAHWHHYVETAEMVKTGRQVTHALEDVDYAEGDGFSVEILVNVPESERSQYREFAEGSGS